MLKKIAVAAVLGGLVFISCSKSSNATDETAKKMQGTTWRLRSIYELALDQSTGVYDTVLNAPPPASGSIGAVVFDDTHKKANWNISLPDGSLIDTSYTYSVLNAQLFVEDKDTLHIQTLTDTSFVFYEQTAGYKATFTLFSNQ